MPDCDAHRFLALASYQEKPTQGGGQHSRLTPDREANQLPTLNVKVFPSNPSKHMKSKHSVFCRHACEA